jgi:hypothetical protein
MLRITLFGLFSLSCFLPVASPAMAGEAMIWFEPVVRDFRQSSNQKSATSMNRGGSAHASERPDGRTKVKWGTSTSEKGKEQENNRNRSGRGRKRQAMVRTGRFPAAARSRAMHTIGQRRGQRRSSSDDMVHTDFFLEMPDNSIIPVEMKKKRGAYKLAYQTKQGGSYRLVGYNSNNIKSRSRQHLFSFYNFMTHGDKPEKKEFAPSPRPGYHNGKPIFELVRLYDSERERYRSRTGHTARVQVLFKGKPVAGAPLTLTTSKNWAKSVRTNEHGEAELLLIKDDFQDGVIDRRKSSLYMLQTEYTEQKPGQLSGNGYDKQHYVATLSFRVSPDSKEWESKRVAFLLAMITIIGAGVAIAIRRKRRRKMA